MTQVFMKNISQCDDCQHHALSVPHLPPFFQRTNKHEWGFMMIPIRTIVINLTLLMLLEMAIAPFLLIGDVVTYIEIRQLGIMIFIGLNQFIALTIFPTAAAIILAL